LAPSYGPSWSYAVKGRNALSGSTGSLASCRHERAEYSDEGDAAPFLTYRGRGTILANAALVLRSIARPSDTMDGDMVYVAVAGGVAAAAAVVGVGP